MVEGVFTLRARSAGSPADRDTKSERTLDEPHRRIARPLSNTCRALRPAKTGQPIGHEPRSLAKRSKRRLGPARIRRYRLWQIARTLDPHRQMALRRMGRRQ